MSLLKRYAKQINGVYSCFDRVVINGTLPGFCYAEGMTSYLYTNKIRIFDYTKFVEPLRNEIRLNAEQIAKENTKINIKILNNLACLTSYSICSRYSLVMFSISSSQPP